MELLKSVLKKMFNVSEKEGHSKLAIYVPKKDINDFLEVCHNLGYKWMNGNSLFPRTTNDAIVTHNAACPKADGIYIIMEKYNKNQCSSGLAWVDLDKSTDADCIVCPLGYLVNIESAKFAQRMQTIIDMKNTSFEERNKLINISIIDLFTSLKYDEVADTLQEFFS